MGARLRRHRTGIVITGGLASIIDPCRERRAAQQRPSRRQSPPSFPAARLYHDRIAPLLVPVVISVLYFLNRCIRSTTLWAEILRR